jgi:alkylhydroperoxidase family enzyme
LGAPPGPRAGPTIQDPAPARLTDLAVDVRRRGLGERVRHAPATQVRYRYAEPADFATVLDFVDACVTGTTVPDDVFTAAHNVLSDKEIVTVIVLVGHYLTVARLTGVLAVDLDSAPDPWTHEH